MTAQDRALLGPQAPDIVRRHLSLWQDILPTPLIPLPEIARSARLGSVMIKDEGQRLGLGSFKALGGAYAVMRIFHRKLQEHLGRTIPIDEIVSAAARSFARTVTFCCATDGNHGKSVAAGAKVLGCRSAIFVHQGVTEARASAIGSDLVVRVTGNYDDSVLEAKRVAMEENWILVSDTSWPGYEEYPSIVAQGYTVLADEALAQYVGAGLASPTHVFLQAGVGGFASSISAHLVERLGRPNIRTIVVEPDRAACLFESAIHGGLTSAPSTDPTIMAMLECYTPSLVGWRILQETADAFMTVTDDEAKAAMRALALRGGHSGHQRRERRCGPRRSDGHRRGSLIEGNDRAGPEQPRSPDQHRNCNGSVVLQRDRWPLSRGCPDGLPQLIPRMSASQGIA
jgi:diaminopropionate ammonia-lyase